MNPLVEPAEPNLPRPAVPAAEPLPVVPSVPPVPPPLPAFALLAAWVLPQLALLALNWADARFLLRSQSPLQQQALWTYATLWLVVCLLGSALLGWHLLRRRPIGGPTVVGLAVAPLGLLWAASALDFWPSDLAPWMMSRENVETRQAMLLLVPTYVGLWMFVHWRRDTPLVASFVRVAKICSLALLVTVPLAIVTAGILVVLVLPPALGLGVVGLAALLLSVDARVRREPETNFRPTRFAVAFLAPLAGLLLNSSMQYPANFQAPGIYALMVANAVALCWPEPQDRGARRLLWLARCATVPFTAYFLVVFLPFMAFWLPGMMLLGLGLLLLAPAALANLHFPIVVAGWREHCTEPRSVLTAGLALAACTLLPVAVLGHALAERENLRTALQALAYPSLRAGALPQIDAAHLRRSLELSKRAESALRGRAPSFGLTLTGLPIVDDLRRQLVLGGLMIPHPRRRDLIAAFLPQDAPEKPPLARRAVEPVKEVQLVGREVTTTPLAGAPGWEQTRVSLRLAMSARGNGEWVARIELPPGAFVTDHGLVIEQERVPSRLTDRNTALFVYERITRADAPRDPGLLIYTGLERAEIRVFPVLAGQERVTDLTFTHRAGAAERIVLDGQALAASASAAGDTSAQLVPTASGTAFYPAPGSLAAWAFVRTPEVHVLADGAAPPPAISSATYWRVDAQLARVDRETAARPRPAGAPVWPADVLLRTVLAEFQRGTAERPELRPQVAWALAQVYPSALHEFARTMVGDWAPLEDATERPVAVLRCGGILRAVVPGASVVWFDGAGPGGPVEVYDRAQKRFVPLPAQVSEAASVRASVEAWLVSRERELQPARFLEHSRRLFRTAREARTLTPQTAFIVVESLAQWAILERKEKERENAPDVLETPASVPEPGTWALLLGGGAGLALAVRRGRSTK